MTRARLPFPSLPGRPCMMPRLSRCNIRAETVTVDKWMSPQSSRPSAPSGPPRSKTCSLHGEFYFGAACPGLVVGGRFGLIITGGFRSFSKSFMGGKFGLMMTGGFKSFSASFDMSLSWRVVGTPSGSILEVDWPPLHTPELRPDRAAQACFGQRTSPSSRYPFNDYRAADDYQAADPNIRRDSLFEFVLQKRCHHAALPKTCLTDHRIPLSLIALARMEIPFGHARIRVDPFLSCTLVSSHETDLASTAAR
jgi:hypothetical protein